MDGGLATAAFPHWDNPVPQLPPPPQLTSSGLGLRLWGSSGPTPASTGTTVVFLWCKKAVSQGRHGLGRALGLGRGA